MAAGSQKDKASSGGGFWSSMSGALAGTAFGAWLFGNDDEKPAEQDAHQEAPGDEGAAAPAQETR